MIKRTLVFESPSRLHLKGRQLVAENTSTGAIKRAPVEDLGVVLIENQQVALTVPLLNTLVENNCAVVFCNDRHMPASVLWPLDSNNTQAETFRLQLSMTDSMKKALWKQTVKRKIRNQAGLLEELGLDGDVLKPHYSNVRSGDSTNREGVAASLYWDALLGPDFIRGRFDGDPNPLLNYGYSVLRAAMSREIMGSGLFPAIGLFHRNRYNAFPLADDLMEPYRPYVDRAVLSLVSEGVASIDGPAKTALLGVLMYDVRFGKTTRPLSIGLTATTASLCRCLRNEAKELEYPEL